MTSTKPLVILLLVFILAVVYALLNAEEGWMTLWENVKSFQR